MLNTQCTIKIKIENNKISGFVDERYTLLNSNEVVPLDLINFDKPTMTENEISLLNSYLKPDKIVFEWGSGGSTIYIANKVKHIYSVEYSKIWYILLYNILKERNLLDKVDLYFSIIYGNIPKEGNYDIYRDYIEMIEYPKIEKYDIVINDGRCRVLCAKKAIEFMNTDSIMFLHDYDDYRKNKLNYKEIEEYFDIIEQVDKLVILKKI